MMPKGRKSHDHEHRTFCIACKLPYSMYMPSSVKNALQGRHQLQRGECTEMDDKQVEMFIKRICEQCYDAATA